MCKDKIPTSVVVMSCAVYTDTQIPRKQGNEDMRTMFSAYEYGQAFHICLSNKAAFARTIL
ncbi:hypothetical protein GGI16_008876 [Coemansia sp. S142-1]|nr:hypothetical protein GGI16_008876 [Coemansia sp. S142-1]